ncbi:hypothetical protein JMJ77_0008678 [Colletotrichum scovillei]|nr:hypothetical protein JMJ78_0001538 [Colletotrichum scovillei]KAG7040971.1 hypothetical protein JMJ77_0008678 [Colletotrichum scovillei]KAG7061004.1 hypothetical protein JMJ76_0010076 [Colletotrichum scovillei]
MLRTTV